MNYFSFRLSLFSFSSKMIFIGVLLFFSSNNLYSQNNKLNLRYTLQHSSKLSSIYSSTISHTILSDSINEAKIQLQGGIIRSSEFVFGNNPPQDIYDFSGVTYTDEFDSILAIHPAAQEKAHDAIAFNAIGLAGYLVVVGVAVKIFIDAISSSNEVSSGNLPSTNDYTGEIIALGASLVVSIITGIISEIDLRDAVNIFNKSQGNKSKDSANSSSSSLYKQLIQKNKFPLHFTFDIRRDLMSNFERTFYFGLKYNF